ncbi:serine-threonine protein kinase, plant-type, putative [Ricinus communis]|uniref:Serine-threonine protein kinase, plant-type, putative n=2 Tax=Ricinus communis TaxID=3988 RepID=B9RMG7_RICCO|nr:serine-threonine protein kinase, plant-type, putative [Ricinus communis]
MDGIIPDSIGHLPNLISLDLTQNSWKGVLSETHFLGQKKLESFSISSLRMFLSINISHDWIPSFNLKEIQITDCDLQSMFPAWLKPQKSLYFLIFKNTAISGNISDWIWQLSPQLTSLDLSDLQEIEHPLSWRNKFTDSISEWIGESMPTLEGLGLRGNMFTGNISERLCSLVDLHILDLAENNPSGFILSYFGYFSKLKSPPIYFPQVLYSLVLYEEKMDLVMKGRQVEQIRILGIVNVINLSRNNFMEEIPEEISNLAYLGSLNSSWNQLTGKIPEKLKDLKLLETLDLSSNHLSGPIPPSMTSMTLLNYLNLSHNDLSGPIPTANQFQTYNDPSIYGGTLNFVDLHYQQSVQPPTMRTIQELRMMKVATKIGLKCDGFILQWHQNLLLGFGLFVEL